MCALLLTRRGFGSVARIDIFLVVGLIALAVILSAVLFFMGTFGTDRHQKAAQEVLAILLGGTRHGRARRR